MIDHTQIMIDQSEVNFVPTLLKLVLIANAGQTSIWLVTWDLCNILANLQ